ncbi:MAG TPA: hypothetical protein VKN76_00685 [Kiloniellaceae bacterium]|nr:hypothetical protein [Kiloniellaceae bacterium]
MNKKKLTWAGLRAEALEALEAELGVDFHDFVTVRECAEMIEERAVSLAKSIELKRAA